MAVKRLNWSSRLSKWEIDAVSRRKTVVSSAYMVVFTSWFPIINPFMQSWVLVALARRSRPITKRRPDSGHPCLTPRVNGTK